MNDGFVGEALRRYRTGINTTTHAFLSVEMLHDDIMVVWPRTVLLCDTRCFCSSPSFIILAGLRCWLISSRRIVQRSCNGIIFCWSFSCWSGLLWHGGEPYLVGRNGTMWLVVGETGPKRSHKQAKTDTSCVRRYARSVGMDPLWCSCMTRMLVG